MTTSTSTSLTTTTACTHIHTTTFNTNQTQNVCPEVDLNEFELSMQFQATDFQNLKETIANFISASNTASDSDRDIQQKHIQEHLLSMSSKLDKQKRMITSLLTTISNYSSPSSSIPYSPTLPTPLLLSITTQPSEVAVANRYLIPTPVVLVSPELCKLENVKHILSVKLLYHSTEKEVVKTIYGDKDILQGIRQQTVNANGNNNCRVVFNKLKVMEVSSKHKHQAFCLTFELDQYSPQGTKSTIAKAKSTPFHVQSRSTKRKRSEGDEDLSTSLALSPIKRPKTETSTDSQIFSDLNHLSDNLNTTRDKDSDTDPVSSPKEGDPSNAVAQGKKLIGKEAANDYNYVDITDLLHLPQKDAAKKLGISESMLCKRFKESTRRKWPYRYIRKIDKMINMLKVHRENGNNTPEDNDKLENLVKERNECLAPVKIRITNPTSAVSSPSVLSQSMVTLPTDLHEEEDIPMDALKTLLQMGEKRNRQRYVFGSDDDDEEDDDETNEGTGLDSAVSLSLLMLTPPSE